jgi:protein TonB
MRDAVGEELGRRWSEPWPWRSALAIAIALHFALAVSLLLAPTHRKRSLQLPSVQVRMVPPLPSASARPARAAAQPRPAPPSPAPATRPAPKKPPVATADVPRRSATRGAKTVAPPTPAPATAPARGAPGAGAEVGDSGTAALSSPAGGIVLDAGNGGAEVPFPFTYYLTRFVSLVESNWFRPGAPVETRCRVRCRVDRSGRLLEAGIEEPSGVATFDRAALRAIFASTPLPPLPQGFAGQSLTVHLDFGPG